MLAEDWANNSPVKIGPCVHADSGYHGWRTEQHLRYAACLGVEDDGMDEKEDAMSWETTGLLFVDSSSKYNTVDPR